MDRLANDEQVDVVVPGSGAAGLAAAIAAADAGAEVVVLERAQQLGGTTAFSGGGVWIPCNEHMADVGPSDTREEALAYVRAVVDGRTHDERLLELFVDEGHVELARLEATTPLELQASRTFSDYFADCPGAAPCGRTLDPVPYASRDALGAWDELIRVSPHTPRLTLDEIVEDDPDVDGASGARALSPTLATLDAERRRDGVRTSGEALVATLLRGALDRGMRVVTQARVVALVHGGGARAADAVRGVLVEAADGGPLRIGARRGVVLATGGFEWNRELVQAFLGVPQIWPLSPPANEGDGLALGLRAGAAVANMTVAWAFPVAWDERTTYDGRAQHFLGTPRGEPGCIVVNGRGRRFVNEGVSYMDLPRTHRAYDPTTHSHPNAAPAWMVFDARVRGRITVGDLRPDGPTPSWVREAPTLAQLAEQIGVDADGLGDEVERFNAGARRGEDPDFGRGTVWFEGFKNGGPAAERSLAPLEQAPFFAMRLYDGALGTAGGLRTDGDGRVLGMDGAPLPGLMAAGNTTASIFGPSYPAGGVTLGPALVFGARAGRAAAAGR
ncbi:MAG TPA: FAD-dependent oxidoreductase [Conexibacter sp.]